MHPNQYNGGADGPPRFVQHTHMDNNLQSYHRDMPSSSSSSYQTGSIPGVAELMDGNMYPSTLLPSRQIQAHHHHHHHHQGLQQHLDFAPVRLLQSCDSCRRRKIRCSGEKPTCSSCVRYQEICHYSPLATPRRRAGKRARTGEREASGEPPMATTPRDVSVAPSQSAPLSVDAEQQQQQQQQQQQPRDGEAAGWSSEACRMRQDIEGLSRKFDSLNSKLDRLIGVMSKRRHSEEEEAVGEGEEEYSEEEAAEEGEEEYNEEEEAPVAGGSEFSNLIDRTSRFGIDATNVGIISGMMSSIDGEPSGAEGVRVVAAEPSGTAGVSRLETEALRSELVDTFYAHADVNTISFIPRHVFQGLQREKRTPTAMVHVMMADACMHSDSAAVVGVGRVVARGYFIERAYRALFECLEYDSAEHCVALLLFAMVISKAGLHRAWIMHSLSTQMAIRLRFNTIDSPLSALAFQSDSDVAREWKRRVFWQLYTFDLLTTTLSDLPPCLSIHHLRCNAPTPLGPDQMGTSPLAVLGPAVVFCDDQQSVAEQIAMLAILCDISTLQSNATPEEQLFPDGFMRIHDRIRAWQRRMPHYDVLAEGDLVRVSHVFRDRLGLIFLGLLCQYASIFLCLVKDTWLPTTRSMTPDEEATLAWARQTAYESAQVVHRLVPLVRAMRLNTVCPFISCVVFQACIVSLYACAWNDTNEPHRILAAVNSVQAGLDFLEHVTPRWGFAGVLTTSLRSLIVERGFGSKKATSCADGDNDNESTAAAPPPPAEMMRPFLEESQWERILRTGEMPHNV